MRNAWARFVSLSLVAIPGYVFAAGPELFNSLDANQDGFVTAEEVPADKQTQFEAALKTYDKNGDGKLSREEFPAKETEPSANSIFERQDANRDGKLTADEIPAERRGKFKEILSRLGVEAIDREQFTRVFGMLRGDDRTPGEARPEASGGLGMMLRHPLMRALDANSDGELSAEEIANAPKSLLQLDNDGDRKISARELMPHPPIDATGFNPGEMMERRIKEMDKNGDGKLQKDEANGPLAAMFDKADRNGDGELDETEIRQATEVMRERMKEGGEKIREKIREKLGK